MAAPQKENGNTQISNELLEALIGSNINGTEWAVVMLLIRKTYGWNKKEDQISLSQFLDYIPVTKPSLCKALKNLQLVKIIKLVKKGKSLKSSNVYALNKDYDSWQLVKKTKLVKIKKRTSKDFETKLVKKTLHTKDNIQKKDIQKKDIINNTEKPVEEKTYGNQEINLLLKALYKSIGIDTFKEPQKQERQYARHIVNWIKKNSKEEFMERLNGILEDSFKAKNCNSITYLYREIKAYRKVETTSNFV